MKNEEQVSRTRWDVRVRFGTKLELPIMISRLMEGDDPRVATRHTSKCVYTSYACSL
jgi:hypothetical protein